MNEIGFSKLEDENGVFFYEKNPFTGIAKTIYPDGQLHGKMFFKDGKADGELIRYYQSGEIEEKAVYKDGKLQERINYYENSEIEPKCSGDCPACDLIGKKNEMMLNRDDFWQCPECGTVVSTEHDGFAKILNYICLDKNMIKEYNRTGASKYINKARIIGTDGEKKIIFRTPRHLRAYLKHRKGIHSENSGGATPSKLRSVGP